VLSSYPVGMEITELLLTFDGCCGLGGFCLLLRKGLVSFLSDRLGPRCSIPMSFILNFWVLTELTCLALP
jgi:hypothetical protein